MVGDEARIALRVHQFIIMQKGDFGNNLFIILTLVEEAAMPGLLPRCCRWKRMVSLERGS